MGFCPLAGEACVFNLDKKNGRLQSLPSAKIPLKKKRD
jgi:hypothetical protein